MRSGAAAPRPAAASRSESAEVHRLKSSHTLLRLWLIALLILLGLAFMPQETSLSRLAAIGSTLFLFASVFYFTRSKVVRIFLTVIAAALTGFIAWPAPRRMSTQTLREEYVRSLQRYEGAPYRWGGEALWGIDCSGLVRRGLINACVLRGFSTADPGLIRHGLSMWWNDTSALTLGEGHALLTKQVREAPSLNALASDPGDLRPGDLAVTSDGIHVLAWTGHAWIQADPYAGKVHSVKPPGDQWFDTPVKIMRWTVLAD